MVFDSGRIIDYSKTAGRSDMAYIDYGLGVLDPDLSSSPYPADANFDLATLYQNALHDGELSGFEVHHRFYARSARARDWPRPMPSSVRSTCFTVRHSPVSAVPLDGRPS